MNQGVLTYCLPCLRSCSLGPRVASLAEEDELYSNMKLHVLIIQNRKKL